MIYWIGKNIFREQSSLDLAVASPQAGGGEHKNFLTPKKRFLVLSVRAQFYAKIRKKTGFARLGGRAPSAPPWLRA